MFHRCFDSEPQHLLRDTFRKKQEQKDRKTLKKLVKRIGDKSTLVSVAVALHVTHEEVIITMADSRRDIETVTFDVLHKYWYHTTYGYLLEGLDKYNNLQLKQFTNDCKTKR